MTEAERLARNAYQLQWYHANKHKFKDKHNERSRIYSLLNPEKRRITRKNSYNKRVKVHLENCWALNIKYNYGISVENYNKLYEIQNGKCAICGTDKAGKTKKRFCIDHDHATGIVRGLLCDWCNCGIARFEKEKQWVFNAMEYLKKYGW